MSKMDARNNVAAKLRKYRKAGWKIQVTTSKLTRNRVWHILANCDGKRYYGTPERG